MAFYFTNTHFTLMLTKKFHLGDYGSQTLYQGSAPGPRWRASVPMETDRRLC